MLLRDILVNFVKMIGENTAGNVKIKLQFLDKRKLTNCTGNQNDKEQSHSQTNVILSDHNITTFSCVILGFSIRDTMSTICQSIFSPCDIFLLLTQPQRGSDSFAQMLLSLLKLPWRSQMQPLQLQALFQLPSRLAQCTSCFIVSRSELYNIHCLQGKYTAFRRASGNLCRLSGEELLLVLLRSTIQCHWPSSTWFHISE
jgi:hypothetical protein